MIETRVTRTKLTRSAFDFYNRGLQWKLTCAEVAKLEIERVRDSGDRVIAMSIAANRSLASSRDSKALQEPLGPVLVQSTKTAAIASSSGLRRRGLNEETPAEPSAEEQSNPEVSLVALLGSARDCSPLDQGLVQSTSADGDPVARALDAALETWRAERNPRALRRALAQLLIALEE